MAGGLPSFFTGWFSCFRRPVADDAHRDCRDPADDFGFGWVIEGANFLVRMRVRDDDQPSTVDLAPAAHISIPQLGEIRGGEAFDLLQLLNTGHSGTLSTIHANSARQGLARFTSCVLQSGVDLPYRAIKTNIADSLGVVVHIERRPGRRYVSEILEINGYDPDADLFDYGAVFVSRKDQT
jgi:hypothetical protein